MARFLIICLTALVLASCGHKAANEAMDAAEALIDSIPERSIAILDSIRPGLPRARSIRARHTLLSAHAAYKAWQPLPDDSLLEIAADYYNSREPLFYRYLAHYYRAEAHLGKTEYLDAVNHNMLAEDALVLMGNPPQWLARTLQQKADIYHERIVYEEAIRLYKEAAKQFALAQMPLHQAYALTEVGGLYSVRQKPDSAMHCLKEALELAPEDSVLAVCVWRGILSSELARNDPQKCIEAYREIQQLNDKPDSISLLYIDVAEAFWKLGMTDSARHYLDYSAKVYANYDSNEQWNHIQSNIARDENQPDKAYNYLSKAYNINNTNFGTALNNNLSFAERDFLVQKNIASQLRESHYRNLLIFGAIIFALIIVGGAVIYKLMRRNHKMALENAMMQIQDLNSSIGLHYAKQNELQKQLNNSHNSIHDLQAELYSKSQKNQDKLAILPILFKESFKTLNVVSSEYFQWNGSSQQKDAAARTFEKELERLRTSQMQNEIINIANSCHGGIIDQLRKILPKIKPIDVLIFAYISLGFSPKAICLLSQITLSNYYAKTSRLETKIRATEALEVPTILRAIGKD